MAGIKISALPAIPSSAIGDLIPEVQPASGGTTYKATLLQVRTLFGFNGSGILAPANGGTGVNNGIKTITLGGNFTTTGAFNPTLAFTAGNTYTFPSASQTMIGSAGGTLTGAIINYTNTPTQDLELVSKGYVDSVAQGLTIQGACRLATTTALTVTYANGASGVGATLTNAGAQVALSIDGVATVVGNRILVKNQVSTFQNGIYTVTDIGSGATNWVMTRATDYDQASEIQPGDLVIITAGSTLANSSWIETSVVVTIGTDAITFSQFSAALPITVPNGGTGATSFTAFAPIFGGTTSTNPLQSGALGTSGQVLTSNGAGAIATFQSLPSSGLTVIAQQVFDTSGTYTPTSGMQYAFVEVIGAGGGGAGASGSAGQSSAGGGGAGGGYSSALYNAATIGASQTATIGAGGAGGIAAANGATGGTTSLGALLQATGGIGGAFQSSTALVGIAAGGVAGMGSGGTFNASGSAGLPGFVLSGSTFFFIGGNGGSSALGGGGGRGDTAGNANGDDGHPYGGGGAGAGSFNGGGSHDGGAGAGGVIRITEYI